MKQDEHRGPKSAQSKEKRDSSMGGNSREVIDGPEQLVELTRDLLVELFGLKVKGL